jgi:D-alanyl-D-alanine carboxypeptidase-like protein
MGTLLVVASTATSFSSSAEIGELSAGAVPHSDSGIPYEQELTSEPEPEPGELEMQALAQAYPSVIRDVMFRDGDWAVRIGDQWYYWASGRLLPDGLRQDADRYVGIRFYNYEMGTLQKQTEVPVELEPRLRERTAAATSDSDEGLRFNDFLDTLYSVSSLAQAERTMESVQFLGKWIRVHPLMVEPLEHVDAAIRKAMRDDQRVEAYVAGLESIHSYNWRNIAGTMRRSYHSYGVAVDLVPGSYGGKWAYWLWAAESGVDEWWDLPLNDRVSVPQPVIDIFEAEGFIWGGKWLFFDNLHFEYRPESIILARENRL